MSDARPTRRAVLRGAAAAAGVAGAAAFAGSETVFERSPRAVASLRSTATRIDLGAAKYGARGDGSDDSAALRAWRADILAAVRAGASGVHATVPCGIFAAGPGVVLDILADNVHVEGDSRGGSVLTQLDRAGHDILTTPAGGPSARFAIANLTVDGNGAAQSSGQWCVRVDGYGYEIDAVDLVRGSGGGLSSRWADDGSARYFEARIRSLGVRETTGVAGSPSPSYGILWAGPHDSQFSDVIISTLAAGQADTGASYGFVQARGASGEYATNMHIWGRHHYGLWTDPAANGMHLANVVVEGAFVANAVLTSATTWSGGEVYGTAGNGGTQPHELGISLGIAAGAPHAPPAPGTTDGFGCTSTVVSAVRIYNFAAPGSCVDLTHSQGANIVSALVSVTGTDQPAAIHRGAPNPGDQLLLLAQSGGLRVVQSLG